LGQGLAATGDGSSNGGGTDDGVDVQQLELFDFFNSRAKNVIAPLLKYCHYELQVSTYTRLMFFSRFVAYELSVCVYLT